MSDPDLPLVYALIGLYYLSAILALMIAVPLSITTRNFHGTCLLGAVAEWERGGDSSLQVAVLPGPSPRCGFTFYMTVVFPLTYATIVALVHTYEACRGHLEFFFANEIAGCGNLLLLALYAVLNTLVTLMILISSCLYTVGVHEWCDSLTRSTPLQRCSLAEHHVTWSDPHIKSDSFYTSLIMGLASSWILFLIWLCQTGLICFFWMQQAFGRHFYRQGPTAIPSTNSAATYGQNQSSVAL